MSEQTKGSMARYYDDVYEYLKAKFPNLLDSDIQEATAFATNRMKVVLADIFSTKNKKVSSYL